MMNAFHAQASLIRRGFHISPHGSIVSCSVLLHFILGKFIPPTRPRETSAIRHPSFIFVVFCYSPFVLNGYKTPNGGDISTAFSTVSMILLFLPGGRRESLGELI